MSCSYLTGAKTTEEESSIKWDVRYLDEEELTCGDITPCPELIQRFMHWEIEFSNNGSFSEKTLFYSETISDVLTLNGSWQFDDPESPEAIILIYNGDRSDLNMELVSLKEDELKVVKLEIVATLEPSLVK